MITNVQKTDKTYVFVTDKGKEIYPLNAVIVVDDDSDAITYKVVGSRRIIGTKIK